MAIETLSEHLVNLSKALKKINQKHMAEVQL